MEGGKRKAKERNIAIPFELGDMRNFALDKRFNLIFIPFNSIQNTYTREDLEKIFACVKNHLSKDGIFALDVFNPNIHYLAQDNSIFQEINRFSLRTGENVIIKQTMKYNKKSQINRATWHHFVDGQEHVGHLDMRCFFPLEMDMILHYNGFEVVSKYGNFEKELFDSDSSKQIYVCRVREQLP